MPVWPHGDPRDVVRAIVADPRFNLRPAPAAPARRTWLDVLHDGIISLLRRIFHGLDQALGANVPFQTALGFALIAAVCGLLGYLAYRLLRSGRRPRPRHRDGKLGAGVDTEPTSLALRAAARASAATGRFREAAGLLFAAAVRALDERGRLRYDPARTPGEYRRMVGDPVFDAFAADAVVALFAPAEPRGETFERMNRTYDRLFDARAG